MTNRLAARAFPCNYMHLNFPSKPTTVKLKIVLLFYYRGPSPAASRPAKGNYRPYCDSKKELNLRKSAF